MVETLVRSGRYQNASEVLGDELRLVEQQEATLSMKRTALQNAAQAGWDDIASGHYREIEDAELDAFMAKLGHQAQQHMPT